MQLHRVTIESAWRPDTTGRRQRRYLARCLCGWSPGWLATRHEAGGLGDEHRAVARAVAVLQARAQDGASHAG